MKKNSKKVSIPVALTLGATLVMPSLLMTGAYADVTAGITQEETSLTVASFQSEATKGLTLGEFKDSLDAKFGATNANVKVKNPYGKLVYDSTSSNLEDTDVLYQYAGKYTITLSDATDSANSVDLTVQVVSATKSASLQFAENTSSILPEIINPSIGSLTLPTATVVDENGEEITSGASVEVSVKLGNQTIVVESNAFSFAKEGDVYKTGTYQITYKCKLGDTVVSTKTFKVKASTSYSNDYKLTYDFDTTKPTSAQLGVETKLPSVTGKNADTGDEVDVYYTVTATLKGNTTPESDVITFKDGNFYFTPVKAGDYTIKYVVKDVVGHTAEVTSDEFEITDVKDSSSPDSLIVLPYTVDANGNIVGDYTDATDFNATKTSIQDIMLMPIWADDNANGIVDNNLTLYRTLKNSSGTEVFNESTSTALGNSATSITTANKVLIFNSTLSQTDFEALAETDATPFSVYVDGQLRTFLKSEVAIVSYCDAQGKAQTSSPIASYDTYTAIYNSKDAAKYTNSERCTIVVEEGFSDTTVPTIKFTQNLKNAMFVEDEITFTAPTTTDDNDNNLTPFLTFQVKLSGESDFETVANSSAYGTLVFDDEEEVFKFTLNNAKNDIQNVVAVKVTASAYDDSKNLGSTSQEIVVLNRANDTQTIIDPAGTNTNVNDPDDYVQGNSIVLPTVVYSDEDGVDFINVNITIENNGTYFTAYNSTITKDATEKTLTVSGAKFTASLAGQYKVTFTTTDETNNITAVVFYVGVNADLANTEPTFVGLGSEINGGTAELGERIELTVPSFDAKISAEDTLTTYTTSYSVEVVEGPTNYQLDGNYYFTPNEVGTYKIKYVGTIVYDEGTANEVTKTIESKVYTIEVTDTTAPEFVDFNEIEEFYANAVETNQTAVGTLTVGTTLTLQMPEYDATDLDLAKSNVKIASSNSTKTVYLNEIYDEDGVLTTKGKYKFEKNDTYTLTYNLVDTFGNTTSKSVSIDVGDVEAPELTIDDDFINETYKIDDELVIDLSKIKAIDTIDGDLIQYNSTDNKYYIDSNASLKITVKNTTTGNTVTNKLASQSSNSNLRFAYDITEAGEYTVTVAVGDTSSKVATNSDFSFTVSAEDGSAVNVEEVLGVVLVVVSVLLLGGVVTYFIVTRKSFNKKYN